MLYIEMANVFYLKSFLMCRIVTCNKESYAQPAYKHDFSLAAQPYFLYQGTIIYGSFATKTVTFS